MSLSEYVYFSEDQYLQKSIMIFVLLHVSSSGELEKIAHLIGLASYMSIKKIMQQFGKSFTP